jgi:hypothetical protein
MSDASTSRMIAMYEQRAEAPLFLSSFFRSPPENFHDSEKVEIDIVREDEDVAVVVQDLAAGSRLNESSLFTNKAFTPPIFSEALPITAYSQIKRQPGVNPFADPNFGLNALNEAYRGFGKLERKIRRALELMSSQVFQTGILTLLDQNGVALYTLNFGPKATHFTTPTAWAADGSTGDPVTAVAALADVLRKDGKRNPTDLIFGTGALARFLANAKVKELFNKEGMNLATMVQLMSGDNPQKKVGDATLVGTIVIGNQAYRMWSYSAVYKNPQTGVLTPYVGDTKVIMLSEGGRLDVSFGSIPSFVAPEARALPFLPPRIESEGMRLSLTTNSYFTPDGKTLMVEAGTRPLTIPTAIDTFGCITAF